MVREPVAFLMMGHYQIDAALRVYMRRNFRTASWPQTTFVYVTHDQAEALTMSDRMAVMMDGEILQLDTPNEIYKPSNLRVVEFIGSPKINVLPAESDEKGNITCKGITISQTLKNPKKCNLLLGIRPEHMEKREKNKYLTGKIHHKENLVLMYISMYYLTKVKKK